MRRSWWGVSARRMNGAADVCSSLADIGVDDAFLESSFEGAGGGGGDGWM